MAARDHWIDLTGLNLIRVIVGSYFIAVALDLIVGLDPSVLLIPLMEPALADLAGSTLLLCLGLSFMTGTALRLSSIGLTLFVLTSSLAQNFIVMDPGNLSDFWRDLTLICAVILSYATLGNADLRRAAALSRMARLRHGSRAIRPRRVAPVAPPKRPVQRDLRAAYLALSTEDRTGPTDPSDYREDPANIFANL